MQNWWGDVLGTMLGVLAGWILAGSARYWKACPIRHRVRQYRAVLIRFCDTYIAIIKEPEIVDLAHRYPNQYNAPRAIMAKAEEYAAKLPRVHKNFIQAFLEKVNNLGIANEGGILNGAASPDIESYLKDFKARIRLGIYDDAILRLFPRL